MFFLDAGFQSAKSFLKKATVAEVPHEDQFNGKSLVGIVNYIEFHITHVMCALYLIGVGTGGGGAPGARVPPRRILNLV